MDYSPLFQPIQVGSLTLKNRFVMAPMSVHMTEDGSVTDEEIAYIERRAKGGVAMVTVGSVCVHPDGDFGGQIYIHNDDCIPRLKMMTDAVHKHHCLISAQLHHSGRETNERTCGYQPVAPSYFEPEEYSVFKAEYDPPRVLTTKEVGDYVEYYAQGVRRAKEAGFDAVELHCAHGYLICAFMSPLTNHRTDKYGGSFPARMQFVKEIIERARELVGDDFPITARIVGDELRAGGIDMALSVQIAKYLEKLGVAALNVSAGMYPYIRTVPNMYHKRGINLYLADNVREAVHIPVFAAGQLNTPEIQLAALENGKADVICVGRTLICDPDYPNKLKEGRLDDIIYCISCNKACHDRTAGDRFLHCTLNVEVGRETQDIAIHPAEKKKKVLIVGGGPSGMEAARVAALKGHEVTIYEKDSVLGGRLRLAAIPPCKDRYQEACDYLIREVKKLQIPVKLDTEVTEELLKAEKPDAVILASGVVPLVPPIPGLDKPIVVQVDDVLRGTVKVGKKAAVIGGGAVGAETAHWLMEQEKREISIIEMRDGIGIDMPQDARICLMDEYDKMEDLHPYIRSKVLEVGDDSVTLEKDGEVITISGLDTVVLAAGARPNRSLEETAKALAPEVYVTGDAEKPKDLVKAIYQGHMAANQI